MIAWVVPWGVGALLVGAAVWASVTWIGGGDDVVAPQGAASPSTIGGSGSAPTPTPAESASTEDKPDSKPSPSTPKGDPPPAVSFGGTTVQVLNGTGGVTGAAERMADRLARLGFDVIAVDDALGNFDRTTVYWTDAGARPQAEALAARYGWTAAPRRANLSPTVDVHVIVGLDEA